MQSITILSIGKIKDRNLAAMAQEYLKRLAPYLKIKVEEAKSQGFTTPSSRLAAVKAENDSLKAYLAHCRDSEIWVLDEEGENCTSVDFSLKLEKITRPIVFVIGGALGFTDDWDEIKHKKLALSKMTFTHEMARVILLEQIYRAVAISRGKEYHY